jgi:ubiquinone/menaquinone biosynthesis C-methylase UbiE
VDEAAAPLPPEALAYYARGREAARLGEGHGMLEFTRTCEILERCLPPPPARILDVGGGPGPYAVWLARRGHHVTLVDAVELHVTQALAAAVAAGQTIQARVGDARRLGEPDGSVDAVLLLGPLYHLTERAARLDALREAWRVLRADGHVFAVGVSRFASLLSGLFEGLLSDPAFREIVERDLRDGQHRNPTSHDYLPPRSSITPTSSALSWSMRASSSRRCWGSRVRDGPCPTWPFAGRIQRGAPRSSMRPVRWRPSRRSSASTRTSWRWGEPGRPTGNRRQGADGPSPEPLAIACSPRPCATSLVSTPDVDYRERRGIGGAREHERLIARLARPVRGTCLIALAVLALLLAPARAEVRLPPGFVKAVYVTGQGFATGRGSRGIPATSTLVFDRTGNLFLARTGARYQNTEADDLAPVYRVPPGGAQFTPDTEARYLYGPPLRNAQTAAIRAGYELFVTTFDRDRRLGVLYRMVDGRAELFAGGTPPRELAPQLRQPEGVAIDSAGRLYVADRESGLVVRLDPTGRVVDPRYVVVQRPRVLAMDASDTLWIGADGNAEAPWQQGPGEIWRVPRDGPPALLIRGPMPAAIAVTPGGHLLVADRQGAELFAVTMEGLRVPFLAYTQGDAPRGLALAPDTAETRRAGIARDLFVATINLGAWPVNEVVRISGPVDELIRQRATSP